MAKIQFWLSFNNGAERLQLPVNPSNISINSPHGYEDISVSQLGEYTVIGERGLKEFSFSSFLPRDYNESYCEYTNLRNPWSIIETLERWRDSRKPIRLTITGTPINYAVTIRDFSYEAEKAGNVGDIYYSFTLKEYRFINVSKVSVSPQRAKKITSNPRPNLASTKAKVYEVKKGDTLYKIASKSNVFGDGSKWRELYEANKKTIGNNPNLIKVGQKLVIPNV